MDSLIVEIAFALLVAALLGTLIWRLLQRRKSELAEQSARRRFMVLGGIALAGLAVGVPAQRAAVLGYRKLRYRTPRFRDVTKEEQVAFTTLAMGFYANPRSKIVHYADCEGRIRGVSPTVKYTAFAPVTLAELAAKDTSLRANRSVLVASFEWAALDNVAAGKHDIACETLIAGVKQGIAARVSVQRLAELCAVVATRKELPKRLDELEAVVKSDEMLLKRVALWRDEDSQWSDRWKQPKAKWAGIPV